MALNTPLFSVIIPTKDRKSVFDNTYLALLKAIEGFDVEVIIVNDSKDNDVKLIKHSEKVVVVNNIKSGVASARNFGAGKATSDWLLFLDDDMIIFKENINSYLKHTLTSDKIVVNIEWIYPPLVIDRIKKNAFGRFLISHGFTTMRGWNNNADWEVNSVIPSNFITSPNLFVNKKYFIEAGGYNENFPFAGFEDYDFSERLKKQQFKMYIDTTSIMYHNEEDRLNPKEWYKRKERGGETRRVAKEQGFSEIELKHSLPKKIIYSFTPVIEPLFKFTLLLSSPFKFMDWISFFCYKGLIGISTFKGYTKKK
jgi:glycosyltransferase involved in cell wall biosynthesis